MFTTETGAPIRISCLLKHFRGVLKQAGLPAIRFHDLRHTAATLMLADGVPMVTVSKIPGHSSPAITATIYAHALDESKPPMSTCDPWPGEMGAVQSPHDHGRA